MFDYWVLEFIWLLYLGDWLLIIIGARLLIILVAIYDSLIE